MLPLTYKEEEGREEIGKGRWSERQPKITTNRGCNKPVCLFLDTFHHYLNIFSLLRCSPDFPTLGQLPAFCWLSFLSSSFNSPFPIDLSIIHLHGGFGVLER